MTAYRRPLLVTAMLAAVLGLGACSGGPRNVATASSATPTTGEEIGAIAALLDRGKPQAAKRKIEDALEDDPMNASLMMLLEAIEGDAKKALGPDNYPYTVQPGDTMAGLAERFLGNRLKAYQLARYNDIVTPGDVSAGTELRIPGQPPRTSPASRDAPARNSTPPPAPSRDRPTAAPSEPDTAPAKRAQANPAAAKRARAAGLTALNQGKVSRALTLLRQAAALDPGNHAIAADLARAERIARTVRSRK